MSRKMNGKMSAIIVATLSYIILVPDLLSSALQGCPPNCQCNDDTLIVSCEAGDLDVLPIALNPAIQRLDIKNNKIKTIDSYMQFYSELTFLDLSYNHLVNIPQITFSNQKKLAELHLKHNKIGSFTNTTFMALQSLTILNMRGNFLDELTDTIFGRLTKLEELNLGQNRIAKISPKAFDGLVNLKMLYIDDNTLNTVPSTSFPPLKSLAELYLGINSFTSISKDAFVELKGLNLLDLKGAALLNVTNQSFNGLDGLRTLVLSDNRLTRIPTAELNHLTRLEELYLGQNDFEVIPASAFIGLNNLKEIEISGSIRLKKIDSGAFLANPNLEEIIISSNKALSEIQEGALNGLPHLRRVILKDNAITTLADGLFSWNDLEELDLSENPIDCDCRILWLISKGNSSHTKKSVICASPERLRLKELHLLSPEQLGCSHTDPRQQAFIGALLVGAAALITTLALLIYKCRRRIREALKGGWGNSAMGRKEREYQKTFSEEDNMYRHPPNCGLGVHPTQLNNYQINNSHGIRHIPVTEL